LSGFTDASSGQSHCYCESLHQDQKKVMPPEEIKLPSLLLVVNLSPEVPLHWAWRVLTLFPVTAIVAPGGWATAKRPSSDFVAVRLLPRNPNLSLPKLV
jgi:hypothetical protein